MFEKVRDEYVSKADTWKAVPDSAYEEETKQPAIIYGVYHLLRLLGTDFIHNVKMFYGYHYVNMYYWSFCFYLFEKYNS